MRESFWPGTGRRGPEDRPEFKPLSRLREVDGITPGRRGQAAMVGLPAAACAEALALGAGGFPSIAMSLSLPGLAPAGFPPSELPERRGGETLARGIPRQHGECSPDGRRV